MKHYAKDGIEDKTYYIYNIMKDCVEEVEPVFVPANRHCDMMFDHVTISAGIGIPFYDTREGAVAEMQRRLEAKRFVEKNYDKLTCVAKDLGQSFSQGRVNGISVCDLLTALGNHGYTIVKEDE